MKEILQELSDYIEDKLTRRDYIILSATKVSIKLSIDSVYEIDLWMNGGFNQLDYYNVLSPCTNTNITLSNSVRVDVYNVLYDKFEMLNKAIRIKELEKELKELKG